MRTVTVLVIVALFAGAVPESVAAEDVPLGNWTGFAVRLNNNNNQNRQPRVLVVKKVPDPHVAWRGGSGPLARRMGARSSPASSSIARSYSCGLLMLSSARGFASARCLTRELISAFRGPSRPSARNWWSLRR